MPAYGAVRFLGLAIVRQVSVVESGDRERESCTRVTSLRPLLRRSPWAHCPAIMFERPTGHRGCSSAAESWRVLVGEEGNGTGSGVRGVLEN